MKLKSVEDVTRDIILDHAFDIEYMSIGEMMSNYIDMGYLNKMDEDEFDEFQREVDEMICRARIEVIFE